MKLKHFLPMLALIGVALSSCNRSKDYTSYTFLIGAILAFLGSWRFTKKDLPL